jgi:hypothetical protein
VKLRCGANVLLFSVTLAELTFLLFQTPMFTFVDWIYVSQHLLVLVIAFTRRQPVAQDYSLPHQRRGRRLLRVSVCPGRASATDPRCEGWPTGGLVLVTIAAFLSVASLLTLRRSFRDPSRLAGSRHGRPIPIRASSDLTCRTRL